MPGGDLMAVLAVRLPAEERRITFAPGRSLREILDETDIRVRAGCNGSGTCGLCRVKIVEGQSDKPSQNELISLGAGLLSQGVRLACQVRPDDDLQIEILSLSPPAAWRCLEEGSSTAYQRYASRKSFPEPQYPLGATVDLGTTHISITLLDISTGRRLAGRRGLNPQSASGSDVLTRLVSAKSVEQAEKLRSQVIRTIGEGLYDIGSREGIDLRLVGRVVLVGNTAMLALLSGKNHQLLLQPRYWTEFVECIPAETVSWGSTWGIAAEAVIEVVPPLAGFVGSDLLAGVVATGLMENGQGALLIDFGTNTEMALWDGNNLWVASAAGGPAFEGCGISCGMPAEPGAISRVDISAATGELEVHVISGAEPQGLCGSGLVDLLACLVGNGTLNKKGQFASVVPENGFPLCQGKRDLFLTKRDIDIFQRAKAGIGVAIDALLTKAGIGYHELRRVCIAGVFGKYLDVANGQEIGLLPAIPGHLIETPGNTALAGGEAILLSSESEERLREARNRAKIVNLSDCSDFEALFLEHLYLQPISQV